jgi:hypothetical protein
MDIKPPSPDYIYTPCTDKYINLNGTELVKGRSVTTEWGISQLNSVPTN